MTITINFESKFNIGDVVIFSTGIAKPITTTITDIKFTESYKFLYKIDGLIGWYSENSISEPKNVLV